MAERITVTKSGGVADVKLSRADKMNALDDAMFSALLQTAEELAKDESVRCVVMSGEGRAFCAGLDMGNFGKMAEGTGGTPAGKQKLEPRTHGVALGGGFQVMLGSDIRIVHPETKLSIMEIKWGLVPDMAGTPIMRSLCRDDRLRELTYTGRIFSGVEAADYGFATEISDNPYVRAMEMAKLIAGKNPDAIRADKQIFNNLADMTDAEALLQESVLQDKLIGSKNQIEAIMAELGTRPANFTDGR